MNRSASAGAAPAGGTKVAVVNLLEVFNDFEQTKTVNEQMVAYRAKLTTDGEQRMQKAKEKKAMLDRFNPDTPDYRKQRKEYLSMMAENTFWQEEQKALVERNHRKWIEKTYDELMAEIGRVAKKQGYQIVITQEELDRSISDTKLLMQQMITRKVVYAEESVDVTAVVLANLNAAFAKAGGANSVDFAK